MDVFIDSVGKAGVTTFSFHMTCNIVPHVRMRICVEQFKAVAPTTLLFHMQYRSTYMCACPASEWKNTGHMWKENACGTIINARVTVILFHIHFRSTSSHVRMRTLWACPRSG